MRINYGIIMAGALALTTACGAGQAVQNDREIQKYGPIENTSREKPLSKQEGFSRKDGRMYAVGCFNASQGYGIPSNQERLHKATENAREILALNRFGFDTDLESLQPVDIPIQLEKVTREFVGMQDYTCVKLSLEE